MPGRDDELESHLADRLKETRDVANFSRSKPVAGTTGEVERTYELPEHLGGRTIADRFVRGGSTPAPRPKVEDDPKPKGLEHHLKSRLAEVQDIGPGQGSEIDRMLEAYRKRRRDMGGS